MDGEAGSSVFVRQNLVHVIACGLFLSAAEDPYTGTIAPRSQQYESEIVGCQFTQGKVAPDG